MEILPVKVGVPSKVSTSVDVPTIPLTSRTSGIDDLYLPATGDCVSPSFDLKNPPVRRPDLCRRRGENRRSLGTKNPKQKLQENSEQKKRTLKKDCRPRPKPSRWGSTLRSLTTTPLLFLTSPSTVTLPLSRDLRSLLVGSTFYRGSLPSVVSGLVPLPTQDFDVFLRSPFLT